MKVEEVENFGNGVPGAHNAITTALSRNGASPSSKRELQKMYASPLRFLSLLQAVNTSRSNCFRYRVSSETLPGLARLIAGDGSGDRDSLLRLLQEMFNRWEDLAGFRGQREVTGIRNHG